MTLAQKRCGVAHLGQSRRGHEPEQYNLPPPLNRYREKRVSAVSSGLWAHREPPPHGKPVQSVRLKVMFEPRVGRQPGALLPTAHG
jgi:hypothetical protein